MPEYIQVWIYTGIQHCIYRTADEQIFWLEGDCIDAYVKKDILLIPKGITQTLSIVHFYEKILCFQ